MVRGQQKIGDTFGSGINVVGVDSSFHLKFGLRIQTLYEGFYNIENGNYTDNLQIRRFRLKFDGFVLSPRFVYKIELGQSNRDVVGDSQLSGSAAKILLDVVVKYNVHNNVWIWFGQTKLPGNRERVISSQNQEFVDRSLVNSWFNLDRDLGLQVHNEHAIGKGVFRERASISMGEGRNVTAPNIGGYDYTLRLEYLPFGKFHNKGDYFMSDLFREPTPKLSIGGIIDYNVGATRQRGQLGLFMIDSTGTILMNNLTLLHADLMFKYNGMAVLTGYTSRRGQDNIIAPTVDGDLKYGTGDGFYFQSSYVFPGNFEIGGRFTHVKPDDVVYSSVTEQNEYTLGLSKYLVGHSLKFQSDLSYIDFTAGGDLWRFRLQMELAF